MKEPKDLYEIAIQVYNEEKRTKKKFGRVAISKRYNIRDYDAAFVVRLVELFKQLGGAFEKIHLKYNKLLSKYHELKRQYDNLVSQQLHHHDILDSIEYLLSSHIEKLAQLLSRTPQQPNESKKGNEDVILLLSDWHIGESVNPEVVGYLNSFNKEIAEKRVIKLIEKVKEITDIHRNVSNINTLHIACLGDIVSGHNLRDELDKHNELNIADQVLTSVSLLTYLIVELSSYFDEIVFYGVPGNHGRASKKKDHKDPSSSYDYLVYKIVEREIRLLLKDKKIKFFIPNSYFIFTTIKNHNILFSHGDDIRMWNSIPYYGMMRDYTSKQELMLSSYNLPVHYLCIGHFHHPLTINRPLGGIIVNGTLKGVDEYCFNKGLISKPSQTIFGINEKYGRTFLYELYIGEE